MSLDRQRVDFNVEDFTRLVNERGYDLLLSHSQLCPCVDDQGETKLTCSICHNTGFRYSNNVIKIKAVMTSLTKDREFSETGMSSTGSVNITTFARHRIGFADKLTLMSGKIVYSEVSHDLDLFPSFRYPIIDIDEVVSIHKEYKRDIDYSFSSGVFTWIKPVNEPFSIRYITYPVYLVLNFPHTVRGTITKLKTASTHYQDLPIQCTAKLEWRVRQEDLR